MCDECLADQAAIHLNAERRLTLTDEAARLRAENERLHTALLSTSAALSDRTAQAKQFRADLDAAHERVRELERTLLQWRIENDDLQSHVDAKGHWVEADDAG